METVKDKLKSLEQRILESFDDVQYPKEVIAPHECDECFELRKTFENQDWRTIDPQIIDNNFAQLPLFSNEAFHYFLPAYLIYSLENFNDNMVLEFTVYALTPSKRRIKEDFDYWEYKFSNFTVEQMNLIYDFLDLVRENKIDDSFDKIIDDGKENLKMKIEPNLK